jgi:hypothetical protein
MPGLPLRALLGALSTLLLDGQNAVASTALGQGYRFVHPQLSGALADLALADASGNGFGSHRILIKIGLGAYWQSASSYKYSSNCESLCQLCSGCSHLDLAVERLLSARSSRWRLAKSDAQRLR